MNSAKNAWKIIGPGGGGGQFIPAISPHDPDTVLIACDMTGAYITHDGGSSWREFNLRTRVACFAFDPVEPGVIYAGTTGFYRSDDNGEKWRLVFPDPAAVVEERKVGDHSGAELISTDNWPVGSVEAIRIDAGKPDHIYLAVLCRHPKKAVTIFFSNNKGRSFNELCSFEAGNVHTLFIDPESPADNRRLYVFLDNSIFAVTSGDCAVEQIAMPEGVESLYHASYGISAVSGAPIFYVTSPGKWENGKLNTGVFKSADRGLSWKQLVPAADSSLAGPEWGPCPEYGLIAASETDARTVYMSVSRYPAIPEDCASGSVVPYYGIVKSTDEGESWEWVLKGSVFNDPENRKQGWVERFFTPKYNGIGPKGSAPIGLGVCATHPDICYMTDIGSSFKTIDGGANWKQVYSNDHPDGTVSSRGMDVTTCYGVHFDPFDKNHIVITYTDIGLFHSKDGGNTWIHAINGIDPRWSNTCYWMVFDPDVQGRAWSAWAYAHDLPRPKMYRGGRFYQAQGGVSRTDDGLATWKDSNKGMPDNSVTAHIILDPRSPAGKRTLYVAIFEKGVYKSTDDGYTWELKKEGLKDNLNAFRLALLPDGTLFLVVARGVRRGQEVDGALYKSCDGGDHWEKVDLPRGLNAPNDITFDPQNPKRLYLACWPRTIRGREYFGGVYASDDGGESWFNTFDETAHVYGIVIDEDNPSILFINTFDNAAYRTDDKGATWKRLKGYNFHWGHRPVIDPHNKDMVYLTTFGSSVWYGPANGAEDAFEDIYPFGRE